MFHYRPKAKTENKGFTLVEMVVAISIFAFIAAALFVQNSTYNSSVILTNLAYEVALSIRQAQVYGLSVREFNPGSSQFNAGYGIHISNTDKINYLFFADTDNDGRYDGAAELLQTYSMKRGNTIGKFCATTTTGVERCSDTGTITTLAVTFKRPNPDAIIKTSLSESYKSADIQILAPNGKVRYVSIEQTGQISIHK